MKHCFNHSKIILAWLCKPLLHFLHILVFQLSPLWIELTYFVIFSIMGFLALKPSTPKTASFVPKDLDLFFMSVSSVTVSSMSTVEMEVFSNSQLILITILMFVGGEVFTSLLRLQLTKLRRTQDPKIDNETDMDQIELGVVFNHDDKNQEQITFSEGHQDLLMINSSFDILSFVILCYLLIVHFLGATLISLYYRIIPSARNVLREKGLHLATFSVFSTVSTFSNCGFIPANENMVVFKKYPGLLLIMIPQILLGNTLYPACLHSFMLLLQKSTKREELKYMLINPKALGYDHLFPDLHSIFLVITVFGFIVVQLVAFGFLEWDSDATAGLSAYEKVVGSLFQVVNSRHAGESVFNLSLLAPAMVVLFVLMMYLPPYTCFLPIDDGKDISRAQTKSTSRKNNIFSCLLFSQPTYLILFVILICITEREKMKEDPLNFSLLSIVVEVISGYGNVGFSMGYSCKRQIKVDGNCKDASYGFAGKWSNKGKIILIIVMFFGRLKKFNVKRHKAWKLY